MPQTTQQTSKTDRPLVSVLCISFNQAGYITQALDGFVQQQTDFAFEVLIHDDASTDGTADIIRDYAKKYPGIIKPWIEDENQYSKGNDAFVYELFRRAKGEFIAFCEGDDYWSDPLKLQRQADLLRANPGMSLCFHPVKVFFETGTDPDYIFPDPAKGKRYTINGLLKENYIQTNSVMYRKRSYEDLVPGVVPQDWYLHLFHARGGTIGFIPTVMSAYRRHAGGAWWNAKKDIDKIWQKHGPGHLLLYVTLLRMYGDKPAYAAIIQGHIVNIMNVLTEVQVKYGGDTLAKAARAHPELMSDLVLRKRAEIIKDHEDIIGILHALREMEQKEENLRHRLAVITNSRVWKARNKLARHLGREPLK